LGPRLFRPATWFDGSGIVALIPLRRNASRIFRVEYALSASTRSGVVLGVPPQLLMIEMSAITGVVKWGAGAVANPVSCSPFPNRT